MPKETPYLLVLISTLFPHSFYLLEGTNLLSNSVDLLTLGISYKENHTVRDSVLLASFT